MKKNLVLTILTRYTYRKIEPFFRTLRQTGYDGDVVVFYDEVDDATINSIKKWGVKLIHFNSAKFKKQDIKIVHYRFQLFYDFLKSNYKNYNYVLICDIRDLVFQKNPFDYNKFLKINYFCENKKIKDCKINSYILVRSGGEAALKKYGDNLISCAGTTIGDSKTILDYLKLMSKNIVSGNPIDQGQHNFFLYSGKFPFSKCFHNFEGPVLTVSGLKTGQLKFNPDSQVVDKEGFVINIVHQYDRDPVLFKKFNLPRYYYINFLEAKYILFKRGVKKMLFKTPLGGYFKRKYYNPSEFR